jgi:heterodisulfide reductase subunit A
MVKPEAADDLRIGVFVCECGLNKYPCADPGQQEIKRYIREHNLNRVVVASCTPLMHEPTFRQCVSEAGVNPYLFEMTNLREHCSWVHSGDRAAATEKAKDMVKISVARARLLEAQKESEIPVTSKALVLGGGVAGIQAALDLGDAGYQVYLVEKEPSIGGIMAQLDKTYPTMDCSI